MFPFIVPATMKFRIGLQRPRRIVRLHAEYQSTQLTHFSIFFKVYFDNQSLPSSQTHLVLPGTTEMFKDSDVLDGCNRRLLA